ncbi:polyprenyl synthetase family protein [Enterococcus pseudoavium]|uniref:Polyprenyl synthetase family protein n=1 Tax=Enterococcus pseudoavium TaxID=44007 RepID=A0ABU3FEM8_9ENTE|nr:polyprenyl synthetase family protein [Enterococcus pseudoavium]MDT2754476.1 polyprenyl synthetase family protein [Enterococcus pseudoavium]MDT2769468.1 polyprenyl synthetase family protein [Enterococcus pseudoavium]REC31041.1 geranylgeranyl pyrophosphate synthase [Enterococcus pseudoavium]
MKLHPMWQDYPDLAKRLTTTLELMENVVNLKNKKVETAVLEMIHAGGKLLRPAYQLLFSEFGPEQDEKKATALAASIEMLHTATLIHDDIVDDSTLRRGLPTIRSSFGNDTAVYAGDYLFVCCFKLLSDYATSLKSLQLNSRSMEKILDGELGQMDDRYKLDQTVEEYLANISGKTAELFALSCSVGAFESGTSERFAKKAGMIGNNIGLAFQIMDDLLDYQANATTLGKPVLEDVRQGVYSLPLIYALSQAPQQLRPYLEKREQMTADDTLKVQQLVQELGGVRYAQELAADYTEKALKEIRKLPENFYDTKTKLERLTSQILTRQN